MTRARQAVGWNHDQHRADAPKRRTERSACPAAGRHHQDLPVQGRCGRRAARRDVPLPAWLLHRRDGPVRLGQVDPAAVRGRARPADRPARSCSVGSTCSGLNEVALTKLRREEMGFVFQAYNLLPSLTVYDNVALPLRLTGRRPRREGRTPGPRAGRAGGQGEAPPGGTVRRSAATGRDRPRADHQAGGLLRRRTDRRARQRHQPADPRLVARGNRSGRSDGGDGDPRPGRGRVRRAGAVPLRRPGRRLARPRYAGRRSPPP